MFLNRITILNYRNIAECNLVFSPKINCFWGKNGVGKTNLLDTIYYLSFCKSHLNAIDNQLINHNADFFMIQGEYDLDGTAEVVSCAVKQRRKKQFMYNKKEYERLADHIGKFPLVLVSPSDLSLIAEGSDERRRFMDMIISQYDRQYLDNLMTYNSALQSRNALLKHPETLDYTMLEVLEEKMCSLAEPIFLSRTNFIEQFIPVFKEFYRKIANNAVALSDGEKSTEQKQISSFSQNDEIVDLLYISHLQQISLKEKFLLSREKDKILGFTTAGIHKDDLEMTLNGFPLKRTGSQGQNKSYLVAMKLAQFKFLKNISGKTPILLLDDLFDKLDTERVKQIITEISSDEFGQIFITDTNSEHLNELIADANSDYSLFNIINGEVSKK